MSIFDRALHIPAEHPFFAPARASRERVLLPLAARPAPRFYAAVVLAGLAAVACLCMALESIRGADAGSGALMFALAFVAAAVPPAGIAAVGLRDALRSRPLLVIDTDGLRDARLGETVAWTDVAEAEIVAAPRGIAAVRLTLAVDGAARFNPFRLGGWSADWARRRRTRTIALLLLDVRAHALAHTILALAARHGATVGPPGALGL